jgi:hypothetical protein
VIKTVIITRFHKFIVDPLPVQATSLDSPSAPRSSREDKDHLSFSARIVAGILLASSGATRRIRRWQPRGGMKMMLLEKGANFIWENARLLERAVFEYHFYDGPAERILKTLRAYQNEDGGFGHALEPDLRAPDSHPLFVEFGLRTLYECQLRDSEIAYKVCGFLSQHADLEQGIPTLLPSARKYARAAHWHNPEAELPSFDRLAGLIGLVNWQRIHHSWLEKAVEICAEKMATTRYTDAHTISTAFCLLESLPEGATTDDLFAKLANELLQADYFWADAPVTGYGLTPLAFAPTPDSYCRKIFSDSQIEGHLNELESKQGDDGGWPIQWEPPSEMAKWEWRSHLTVNALVTLRAYGRI